MVLKKFFSRVIGVDLKSFCHLIFRQELGNKKNLSLIIPGHFDTLQNSHVPTDALTKHHGCFLYPPGFLQ